MSKPITVRLVGGLGNQLFGYYAGAALAAHHGVPLRLDTSWTRYGITDHGIEILALDLPGEWIDNDSWRAKLSAPGTVPGRAFAKALRDIPALRKPLRIHEAPGVGDDPALLGQPPGTRLRGYFQSWRIVEYAVRAGYPRRPSLRRSSAWLDDMVGRAAQERPIAVHVRRGDYAKVDEFGLLGASYYEPALDALRGQGIDGPVWLFSDEPAIARQALGRYADGAEIVASVDGPATEMLAMSHAAAHVIANSTFSWWGAWMNDPGTSVIAPDPWFASGPSVTGLIPPTWTRLPAG
ncbi:MAG: alpha-1,2-fucosyltransferase [bacterium]